MTDPSGAVVPHATVRLLDTQNSTQQFTGEDGTFRFQAPPGTYTLEVQSEGFAPFWSHNLRLHPGMPLRLPIRLVIATRSEHIEVGDPGNPNDPSDPANYGGALTLSGRQLDLLPSDPEAFRQQLNAFAGSGFGGAGPQILVNGFSGNRLPPKSSIRSIRIGENPYSAYYDSVGFNRIEIDTKPSTDKLHGELDFGGTDQPWDARNPFNHGPQPSFFQFNNDASLTGPLNSKTSFYLAEDTEQLGNNAVVNATVLDGTFTPTQLSEAVGAPQHTTTLSGRLDRQFSKTNFGYLRDEWTGTHIRNSGLGGVNPQLLPASGYTSDLLTNTLQGSDTTLLGARAVNEVRFQYIRLRNRQLPNSTAPTVQVEGAFQDGGSLQQTLDDNADRYELQDRLQFDRGTHSVELGLRFRELRDSNTSSGNFNGLYTFPSIAAYQATLTGRATGLSPEAIRLAGGGASQFNLTTGTPSALLFQDDLAFSGEDDWRLRRGLTLSYGLRLETESAVPDHLDPAPRLGLAWSLFRGKHPAPVLTLRVGYGIFYDRFPAAALLQAIRQNGVTEVAYFLQNPDTFPALPAPALLTQTEPTVYRVSPELHTSYNQLSSLGADRAFGRRGRLSATGIYAHGTHEYLSRNLNAPLPATGARPLGTAENLYQYSSDSNENDELLALAGRWFLPKGLYVLCNGTFQRQYNESDGINTFPSQPYHLRADYGRAPNQFSQSLNSALFWRLPHGFLPALVLNGHSGAPFNITTGADLNGDTVFNDRPALATDLTRSSVVRTALGTFDTLPLPGQPSVARNSATGPGLLWVDLSLEKTWQLGPRPHAPTAAASPATASPTPADRPWSFRFRIEAENLTNRNNPGVPVGVIGLVPCIAGTGPSCVPSASPDFGHALSLASDFSPLTASNRTILLHTYFTF